MESDGKAAAHGNGTDILNSMTELSPKYQRDAGKIASITSFVT